MPYEEAFERGVPWKVIAASPDMMDVTPGNRLFPQVWRSSLAISVYEPRMDEERTRELCGQRIAFVKVTCSITGYQREGTESGEVTFGDEPLETLNDLTSEYLGCYGALLNVAFFPSDAGGASDPSRLPHILDFTPKSRELIRSISDSGEILTGSSRELKFDESRTTTGKNETTIGLEGGYKKPKEEDSTDGEEEAGESDEEEGEEEGEGGTQADDVSAGLGVSGKVSHTWGATQEDKQTRSVGTGETRQSADRFSTTMDQLYSLLTGYHSGTNRASCLLLARPGTLQPTDRRTFAPGLRMLEGIQDFIFVVSRPEDVPGLCIEAALDTGHFPETVPLIRAEPEPRAFTFTVTARAGGRGGLVLREEDNHGQEIVIPDGAQHTFDLRLVTGGTDWVLYTERPGGWFERGEDRSRLHSPGGHALETDGVLTSHPHLREIPVSLRQNNEFSAEAYLTVSPIHARGNRWGREHPLDTIVDKDFRLYARPRQAVAEPTADTAHLLVTRRGLTACYRSDEGCPLVVERQQPPVLDRPPDLFERDTGLGLSTAGSLERVYAGLRRALLPGQAASARGEPMRSLAETDYFARAVASRLPADLRALPLTAVLKGQKSGEGDKALAHTTIGQLLSADARTLSKKTRRNKPAVRALRREVLVYLERRLSGNER